MIATYKLLSMNMAPVVCLESHCCMLLLPQELGNTHLM